MVSLRRNYQKSESESIKLALEKADHQLPWGFIIGPEGGFSPNEVKSITNHSSVKSLNNCQPK